MFMHAWLAARHYTLRQQLHARLEARARRSRGRRLTPKAAWQALRDADATQASTFNRTELTLALPLIMIDRKVCAKKNLMRRAGAGSRDRQTRCSRPAKRT